MASNVSLASAAPAMISHEGAAIAAAVVPSLAGRSITSYAQSFMIAGIIISVIGVALAIFTSVLLTGVGFGFAGIVSVIGVFIAQSAFEGEQLQNSIAQLKGQNAFLEDQRVKLDAAIILLKGENDHLKFFQRSLDLKCKELEEENARIHQLSTDLRLSLQGMTAVNHVLSESKSVLIAKVAELRGYVAEAKSTLQGFVATHTEFSSRVLVFAGAIAKLDATEEVIRSAITDLETRATASLPVLRDHVTLAREISDYIQTRLQEQTQQQSGSIEAFRKEVATLGSHIKGLQDYITELERINAGFALQMEGSQSIASLQGEHREALTSLIRTLDESSARFERERGLFRAEAERLQTTFRSFVEERDALILAMQEPLTQFTVASRDISHPQEGE